MVRAFSLQPRTKERRLRSLCSWPCLTAFSPDQPDHCEWTYPGEKASLPRSGSHQVAHSPNADAVRSTRSGRPLASYRGSVTCPSNPVPLLKQSALWELSDVVRCSILDFVGALEVREPSITEKWERNTARSLGYAVQHILPAAFAYGHFPNRQGFCSFHHAENQHLDAKRTCKGGKSILRLGSGRDWMY